MFPEDWAIIPLAVRNSPHNDSTKINYIVVQKNFVFWINNSKRIAFNNFGKWNPEKI